MTDRFLDSSLRSEYLAIRDTFRRFLASDIAPHTGERVDSAILRRLVPFGAIAGILPEPYGSGLDYTGYYLLVEELGRLWGALRTVVTTTTSVAKIIHDQGTNDQRERWLPPLVTGDVIASFAWTEPEAGSDTQAIQARADDDGESIVLSGTKTLITNAGSAGLLLVAVRRPEGIALVIIDTQSTPVETRLIAAMGLDGSDFGEIVLDGIRLPRTNLLPTASRDPNAAFLQFGRVAIAFACLGAAETAYDRSVAYATTRRQFDRPIAAFQLVQAELTTMRLKIDAMRFFARRAAWLMDAGEPCATEASMAKLHNTETALDIIGRAIQLHGGYGVTRELGIERLYRDLRHLTIGEGSSQIQTLLIGQAITGIDAIAPRLLEVL